jgi:hypothetical protein
LLLEASLRLANDSSVAVCRSSSSCSPSCASRTSCLAWNEGEAKMLMDGLGMTPLVCRAAVTNLSITDRRDHAAADFNAPSLVNEERGISMTTIDVRDRKDCSFGGDVHLTGAIIDNDEAALKVR